MKKIITLLFLSVSFCLFAQINFENSLANTFKKAKQQNKAVFIEYYNETCSVCKKVQPILDSKNVGNLYNTLFISYKINTNQEISESDQDFLKKHKLFFKDVPNFIYFDANENFLHYTQGKADADYINTAAGEALNPAKQTRTLASRIQKGDTSIKNLYEYSFLAQLNEDDELVNKIADALYKEFNKEKLGNNASFYILKNAVFTTQNGFFDYFVRNQDKFSSIDSGQLKGKEIEVLKHIISLDLSNEKLNWTNESIENMRQYITATQYSSIPEVLLIDKRLTFDSKNTLKQLNDYLDEVINNASYNIDDSAYILAQIYEKDKSANTKKVIKKFALQLSEKTKNKETLKKLHQLTK
nr:thioredoxin family protein [uncultured Flavobacterium sp.]